MIPIQFGQLLSITPSPPSQVYFTYLRLVTSAEVNTLDSLLPSVAATSTSEKTSKRDVKAEPEKSEDNGDRRLQMLLDQYKLHLVGLPFLKAPCILDLIAVLGAKNAALSSRLVKGLYEFRAPFAKEVNDTLKESVKVQATRQILADLFFDVCPCPLLYRLWIESINRC